MTDEYGNLSQFRQNLKDAMLADPKNARVIRKYRSRIEKLGNY